MDPFESDNESQAALATPKRISPHHSHHTHPPPSSAHVADPFKVDGDDSESTSSRSHQSPPASIQGDSIERQVDQRKTAASASAKAGPSRTPRPAPPPLPDIDDETASQLLFGTAPGPSRFGSGSTKFARVDEEADQDGHGARDEETASTSTSGRRRTKQTSGSIATLKAIGRRIKRAAIQAQDEDAERHQRGAVGPIRLEASVGESGGLGASSGMLRGHALRLLSEREKAMWLWANVEDLDEFLPEVYAYYTGKGVVCIVLTRVLNLLTVGFVVGFSTFLFGCVDYSKIKHDGQLSDILVGQCVSKLPVSASLLLIAFVAFYGLQVVRFCLSLSRLRAMSHFFQHLLGIPEADVQTIPWHQVVARISNLLDTHPISTLSANAHPEDTRQTLDVHEAANRLMRQENYLIALFNQDLLDLKVPIPGLDSGNGSAFLTRSLQWNLEFCLLGYLFNQSGNVRRQFLTDRHRTDLIAGLKRRLVFMAALNAVFAPLIVLYLLIYSFFRYFEEYHKNPASLGSRQYTELARWKFREYNELPHLFRKRCRSSYPYAQRYIEQFPKERTAILARFVSFIAGSFTAVLVLASVLDPDLFVHFEITPQRNTLFYIGVFGAILAASRAMVPDERLIFEPEVLLEAVIFHTHYCPEEWKGRYHSAEVNAEFGKLYSLKITIFLVEVLSVLLTPLVLCFSLPKKAPAIIDFFREFTVHVDGLGYVCSYAVFDFARHGKTQDHTGLPGDDDTDTEAPGARRSRGTRDDKMAQSALHFAAVNEWQPDPASSLYLSRLQTQYQQQSRGKRTTSAQSGGDGGPLPASVLAQRSQAYDEAFERSALLSRTANKKKGSSASRQHDQRSARRGKSSSLGQGEETSTLSGISEDGTVDDDGVDEGSFADAVAETRRKQRDQLKHNTPWLAEEEEEEAASSGRRGANQPKSLMQHVTSVL